MLPACLCLSYLCVYNSVAVKCCYLITCLCLVLFIWLVFASFVFVVYMFGLFDVFSYSLLFYGICVVRLVCLG